MQQKDRVQKIYDGIFRALAGLVEITDCRDQCEDWLRNDSVGEGLLPLPYGKSIHTNTYQCTSIHLLHYCVTRRTLPKYHAPRPSFTAPATPSRI